MNHKDFKELYREYKNINAPSGLKYRILSAAERDPGKSSHAGKIAVAASIAAILLIGVIVICAASLFNGNEESSKILQIVSNGTAETSPAEVPAEAPTEIPAETPADTVRSILVSPELSAIRTTEETAIPELVISDMNGLILPGQEEKPADLETDNPEQPVMRVADAAAASDLVVYDDAEIQIAGEDIVKAVNDDIVTEPAFHDEASPEIILDGDPIEAVSDDIVAEPAINDEVSPDIILDEEPGDPDLYRLRDQEDPDWSLLKDHDTDALQVDYDPMLFNDKERPIYESCDHEWTSEIWPGGEVIVCSKCGVHLDMWLYNGYSE